MTQGGADILRNESYKLTPFVLSSAEALTGYADALDTLDGCFKILHMKSCDVSITESVFYSTNLTSTSLNLIAI